LNWYRKSADQGSADGEAGLGHLYSYGFGVTRDYAQALKWIQKSANQGNSHGQVELGEMFARGAGVTKNYDTAMDWFKKAAAQGDVQAYYQLGSLPLETAYYARTPDTYDLALPNAIKWFRKAAELGDHTGEVCLGIMIGRGKGVPKDEAEGLRWLQKAADQGSDEAARVISAYERFPQNGIQHRSGECGLYN
jgi:TPR repeat protein